MGILKNIDDDIVTQIDTTATAFPHIEQILNNNPSVSASSDDDDETVYHPSSLQPTPLLTKNRSNRARRQKQMLNRIPKPTLQSKTHSKKSQGQRQAKRHENMCFLLNLATDLDEDFAAVNINDLVENTTSAFAELLLNKKKMKMWNEFIDLPEDEQERILKLATDHEQTNMKKQEFNRCTSIELNNSDCSLSMDDDSSETFIIIEKKHTINLDQENIVYSADQRFNRIDSNIRYALKSMLKRRHLPLERIMDFEDDLIPFFNEHSDSVYIRDLNNSFDRMLLHAVSQYLNLISKSFTKDGERYTQVENHRLKFIPPNTLLSEYMKTIDGSRSNG